MRYQRPQITNVYSAVSSIQSEKGEGSEEVGSIFLTNGAAYQVND